MARIPPTRISKVHRMIEPRAKNLLRATTISEFGVALSTARHPPPIAERRCPRCNCKRRRASQWTQQYCDPCELALGVQVEPTVVVEPDVDRPLCKCGKPREEARSKYGRVGWRALCASCRKRGAAA